MNGNKGTNLCLCTRLGNNLVINKKTKTSKLKQVACCCLQVHKFDTVQHKNILQKGNDAIWWKWIETSTAKARLLQQLILQQVFGLFGGACRRHIDLRSQVQQYKYKHEWCSSVLWVYDVLVAWFFRFHSSHVWPSANPQLFEVPVFIEFWTCSFCIVARVSIILAWRWKHRKLRISEIPKEVEKQDKNLWLSHITHVWDWEATS